MSFKKYFKSPWLEAIIMLTAFVIGFGAITAISLASESPIEGMSTSLISLLLMGFFLISFLIAVVSVIAGIGGGVIFTPIMLAFTPINSLIVRATGTIVAMFSALMSTGVFIKKGLGNLRISLVLNISQACGALIGAVAAVKFAATLGVSGEAAMRIALGLLLVAVSVYFIKGGRKLSHPEIKNVDRLTAFLGLGMSYYEESEERVVSYKVTRILLGFMLMFVVGAIGGFFGMGGGWAIVPVQNLAIMAPLKVAAANSGIIIGVGGCVSTWPYLLNGAIIPLFVAPWLLGQVIGGYLGSLLLARIRVSFIRMILIGVMFFTSFGLVTKGMELLRILKPLPPFVSIAVFFVISFFVVTSIVLAGKKNEEAEK